VSTEIKRRWSQGSNIADFIKSLVEPFLAWQFYYDAFGKPPDGVKGLMELMESWSTMPNF
jgi:hypothetical protein